MHQEKSLFDTEIGVHLMFWCNSTKYGILFIMQAMFGDSFTGLNTKVYI